MEILAGGTGTVKFTVPSGLTATTFAVYKNETQVGATGNATISGTVATCVLPYAATAESGDIEVRLSFTFQSANYTKSSFVQVVTPILPLYEIKEILETTDDAEAIAIERSVRHIIEVFCAQKFEFYTGIRTYYGSGNVYLSLTERLISIASMNSITSLNLDIRNDGFMLIPKGVQDVSWSTYQSYGPIIDPYTHYKGMFHTNTLYAIDGEWGWRAVPEPVQEAARLLINDYACADSAYRDRFIVAMTAADWRIQLHPGAYIDTGNVRANQLLTPYKVSRISVI